MRAGVKVNCFSHGKQEIMIKLKRIKLIKHRENTGTVRTITHYSSLLKSD
jgi:hypothetical protein